MNCSEITRPSVSTLGSFNGTIGLPLVFSRIVGHGLHAPWPTQRWLEQRREGDRPNAFVRLYQNQWVNAVSSFVSMADWDACTAAELRPVLFAPELLVWIGVDASLRHDATALVAVMVDTNNHVRLVNHRVFRPSPDDPIGFDATVVATLNEWTRAYSVRRILAEPYQMESVIQRLQKQGLPIESYNQTSPGLTQMASNLFDLVRARTLTVYRDDEMRKAVLMTVASESGRGWKLSKEKQSHKIDVVVALAMACLGAMRQLGFGPARFFTWGSDPRDMTEIFPDVLHEEDLPTWDLGFSTRDGPHYLNPSPSRAICNHRVGFQMWWT
jgi:hypothetical protein